MDIKIDKNIPITDLGRSRSKSRDILDVLGKMDVGDSFAIDDLKTKKSVAYYSSIYGKSSHKKFALRTIDNNKYRCWRTF